MSSFALFVTQINDGDLHGDLSAELQDLLVALRKEASTRGKAKGTLTLKLGFKVEQNGLVTVTGEIDTKEPKSERGTSMFWLDEKDRLVTKNPRQQELPLREVKTPERDAAKSV